MSKRASGEASARQINPWHSLIVLCAGTFVILLDTTIVNVAVPDIMTSLHSGLDAVLWVLNAYLLVYAALLIVMGRFGDTFGPRNAFALGLGVFTVASILCGVSANSGELIAARCLQAVGAALLTPQPLVIVAATFPANRRGGAYGILSAVAGVAAISGPTLGGLLITDLSWRWIFYVNVPVGLLGIYYTLKLVPDIRPGTRHRMDLLGVGLLTGGLVGLIYGLVEGQRYDWGQVTGIVSIPLVMILGALLLVAFVFWEARAPEPLMPLDLFRNRNFAVVTWLNVVLSFALFGFLLAFILDTQDVRGWSALRSGLSALPMTISLSALAPITGRLTDKLGGRRILAVGLFVYAVGIELVNLVTSTTVSTWDFLLPLVVTGVGMGFIFAPSVTEAMREIPPVRSGAASGVLSTARQIGSAAGAAIIGAVLQNRLIHSMQDEAIRRASALPAQFRGEFVNGFADAAKRGLQLRSGTANIQLPPDVPADARPRVLGIAHDVFVHGATSAMHPTMWVVSIVLLVGSASAALLMRPHRNVTPDGVPAKAAEAEATVAL